MVPKQNLSKELLLLTSPVRTPFFLLFLRQLLLLNVNQVCMNLHVHLRTCWLLGRTFLYLTWSWVWRRAHGELCSCCFDCLLGDKVWNYSGLLHKSVWCCFSFEFLSFVRPRPFFCFLGGHECVYFVRWIFLSLTGFFWVCFLAINCVWINQLKTFWIKV